MKKLFPFLPIFLAFALIAGALSTAICWKPTDIDAALAWNLAIILTPVFALIAQWKAARERQMPILLTLTVIAILNTTIILGSRLGAWKGSDWMRALTGEGLPDLPGKTVIGGLVLMVLVYMLLKRWWRLPAGLADIVMLGMPLAATIGRVGCLVAGCCYGIPTDSDWGICYGPGTPAYTHAMQSGLLPEGATSTALLFPIQTFFIAGNLLIFTILWHFRKRFVRPGALALLGLSLLTIQRFGLEFVRDIATNRGAFGMMWSGLKLGQWVLLLLAAGSIAGFYAVQFLQQKNTAATTSSPGAGTAPQAYALGFVTFGSFLLRDLLTLDETMVILVSCAPAVVLLGRQLRREYKSGRPVLAPASMLSATALVLMLNPADTIPIKVYPGEWKQWMEVGAGGSFGSYKEISRDCDGNVISTDIVQASSGGGELSANWQRGWTKLQVGLRGTFGNAHTNDNNSPDNNNRYSSFGVKGAVDWKAVGLSVGLFNRRQTYPPKVGWSSTSDMQFSASFRLGRLDRYFFDARYYDEPALGFSNEPPFSIGLLNLGFNDPTGNSLLRAGIAVTNAGEPAFHVAGQFPIGNSGLNGSIAGYFGNAARMSLGLKYRFRER